MDTQSKVEYSVSNRHFSLRGRRIRQQIASDAAFRKWFISRITDPEDPEAVEDILRDLTGPLVGDAAREVGEAVRGVWQSSDWLPLQVTAAAALLCTDPTTRSEDALLQTLVEGLGSDEEGVPVRAAEALASLSAAVRLRKDVLSGLLDLVRNPGADMNARCVALDALVCGHSTPEVRALAQSLSQADIPVPLRREAQCLLDTWKPSTFAKILEDMRNWLVSAGTSALLPAKQWGGPDNDYSKKGPHGEESGLSWKILEAEDGSRELVLTSDRQDLQGAVVLLQLTGAAHDVDFPPVFVVLQPYGPSGSIGHLRLISAAGPPDQIVVVPPEEVIPEMAESLRLSYQSARLYDPEAVLAWDAWISRLPENVEPLVRSNQGEA